MNPVLDFRASSGLTAAPSNCPDDPMAAGGANRRALKKWKQEVRVALNLQSQPAYIIKMRAKSGSGDRLFELATSGMKKSGASDRFIILREDADPDVLWNIEVFRSEAAKTGYEESPLADQLRDEILELLAEPPMRVAAHPYSAAPE